MKDTRNSVNVENLKPIASVKELQDSTVSMRDSMEEMASEQEEYPAAEEAGVPQEAVPEVSAEEEETAAGDRTAEAAEEIARQIRLRDLGGIIIIDFIDMVESENKNKVLEHMAECVKQDRTKVQVVEMSKLCLLEMTRKPIFGRKI